MAIFSLKHRSTLFVLSILFLAFIFFLNNLRSPSRFGFLERELFSIFSQIQKTTKVFFSFPVNVWRKYVFLLNTEAQNQALTKEIERLRQEKAFLRESALANSRLRELLKFKKGSPLKLVAAEVIGVDSSSYFKSVFIDKGEKAGIKKDMGVISPSGIVGRILKVADSSSMVLLLIDQNFALDALVQRTRSGGVVAGFEEGLCKMKYVLPSEDIRSGDLVVASGLEGVFSRGMIIGKIISIKKNKPFAFQDVLVRPMVEFGKLEEVFVVMDK